MSGLLLAGLPVRGQLPALDPAHPAGLDLTLLRLFGTNSFTATAEVRQLDKSGAETLGVPMSFALMDNNLRIEIDIAQFRHKDFPAALAGSLKQLGMSPIVSLVRRDKQSSYIIYPELKSYLALPLDKDTVNGIQRNDLGKETLDGHPCVKRKVVMRQSNGPTLEATVWYASDLKDFPIQIQTAEKDSLSILTLKNVRLVRPDARQFETPASFKQYTSYQQMIQGLTSRLFGGGEES